jgi:hypothetical protein
MLELVLQPLAQMLSAVEHQPSAPAIVDVLPPMSSRAVLKAWIARPLANALTLMPMMAFVAKSLAHASQRSHLAQDRLWSQRSMPAQHYL